MDRFRLCTITVQCEVMHLQKKMNLTLWSHIWLQLFVFSPIRGLSFWFWTFPLTPSSDIDQDAHLHWFLVENTEHCISILIICMVAFCRDGHWCHRNWWKQISEMKTSEFDFFLFVFETVFYQLICIVFISKAGKVLKSLKSAWILLYKSWIFCRFLLIFLVEMKWSSAFWTCLLFLQTLGSLFQLNKGC